MMQSMAELAKRGGSVTGATMIAAALLFPLPAVEVLPPPGTDEPPLTLVDPEVPVVPADGPDPPLPSVPAPMLPPPQAATTVERAVSAPNNLF